MASNTKHWGFTRMPSFVAVLVCKFCASSQRNCQKFCSKIQLVGTSLMVHWLRICASTSGSTGLILGQGTKIPHAMELGKRKKNHLVDFSTTSSPYFPPLLPLTRIVNKIPMLSSPFYFFNYVQNTEHLWHRQSRFLLFIWNTHLFSASLKVLQLFQL